MSPPHNFQTAPLHSEVTHNPQETETMKANEVIVSTNATEKVQHSDATPQRKIDLATDLIRGLHKAKCDSWKGVNQHAITMHGAVVRMA
jgi:hypothetical protein